MAQYNNSGQKDVDLMLRRIAAALCGARCVMSIEAQILQVAVILPLNVIMLKKGAGIEKKMSF